MSGKQDPSEAQGNDESPDNHVSYPDQGTAYVHEFNEVRVKVTSGQTGGALEVFEENCRPGFQSRTHYHSENHQIFYIVEGEASFLLDGLRHDVSAGACVHIPPNVIHQISSDKGVKMLQIYSPGGIQAMFTEIDSLTKEQLRNPEYTKALLLKHKTVMVEDPAGGEGKGTVLG